MQCHASCTATWAHLPHHHGTLGLVLRRCPGFVDTDMTRGQGIRTPAEGADTAVGPTPVIQKVACGGLRASTHGMHRSHAPRSFHSARPPLIMRVPDPPHLPVPPKVWLALLPEGGPTGGMMRDREEVGWAGRGG